LSKQILGFRIATRIIPVLLGRGDIDSQTALELSQLVRNWILSVHARSELELKKITVDGPQEQTIRIEGGLPQLPGTNISMPMLDQPAAGPVTNGHALAAPTDAIPQLESAQTPATRVAGENESVTCAFHLLRPPRQR
jgi:hypothetical protein